MGDQIWSCGFLGWSSDLPAPPHDSVYKDWNSRNNPNWAWTAKIVACPLLSYFLFQVAFFCGQTQGRKEVL